MTVIKKERVVEGDKITIEPSSLIRWLRTGGIIEKQAADRIEKLERENRVLKEIVERVDLENREWEAELKRRDGHYDTD